MDGCNSVALWQDESDPKIFYGRKPHFSGWPNQDPNRECSYAASSIVGVFKFERQGNNQGVFLRFIHSIKDVPFVMSDGKRIISAYDPTSMIINGERWIAFECAGDWGFNGSVAACAGPLDKDLNLILSRTQVVVDGVSKLPDSRFIDSGSVPKFFSYNSKHYLFWSQVMIDHKSDYNGDGQSDEKWHQLKSFGAEIEIRTDGKLYIKAGISSEPSDSSHAFLTFGSNPGALGDLFYVGKGNNNWLMIGAIGNSGCLQPLDPSPYCYRLVAGWANPKLASGIFDQRTAEFKIPEGLKNAVIGYPRIITVPDTGEKKLLVHQINGGKPDNFLHLYTLDLKEPQIQVNYKPQSNYQSTCLTKSFDSSKFQNSQFESLIQFAYCSILNRYADQAGISDWNQQLIRGLSVGQFFRNILLSAEAVRLYSIDLSKTEYVVRTYYNALLGRDPDINGFSLWMGAMNNSNDILNSKWVESLVNQPEFINRLNLFRVSTENLCLRKGWNGIKLKIKNFSPNAKNKIFAFCSILDREVDGKGFEGQTLEQILFNVTLSQEAINKYNIKSPRRNETIVRYYYRVLLGRDPEPEGVLLWSNFVKQHPLDPEKSIIKAFVATDEFKNRYTRYIK